MCLQLVTSEEAKACISRAAVDSMELTHGHLGSGAPVVGVLSQHHTGSGMIEMLGRAWGKKDLFTAL